jgi:lysophospholipase L1-like esterase
LTRALLLALLAVVGVVGPLGPAGCSRSSGSVSSSHDEPGRPLTVIGDSLTVLGRAPIRSALRDDGWDVLVDAFPGRTTADQIPAMKYAAADPRRTVIIELGTNDAIRVADGALTLDEVRATIAEALDLFASRCVVWVLPARDPQGSGADVGAAVGDELRAQAERRDGLHLADFAAVVDEHPDYLLDDATHLTDEGSQTLAELMVRTVRACREPG